MSEIVLQLQGFFPQICFSGFVPVTSVECKLEPQDWHILLTKKSSKSTFRVLSCFCGLVNKILYSWRFFFSTTTAELKNNSNPFPSDVLISAAHYIVRVLDWAPDEQGLRINCRRWSVHLSMAAALESWCVSVSELKCPSVCQSKECSTFLHHQAPFMNLSSCPSCTARMSLCGRSWTGSTAQVRPRKSDSFTWMKCLVLIVEAKMPLTQPDLHSRCTYFV